MLIHTVQRGHYVRTLRPPSATGANLSVNQLVLSDVGQIVLYCTQHFPGRSAKDVSCEFIFLDDKRSTCNVNGGACTFLGMCLFYFIFFLMDR